MSQTSCLCDVIARAPIVRVKTWRFSKVPDEEDSRLAVTNIQQLFCTEDFQGKIQSLFVFVAEISVFFSENEEFQNKENQNKLNQFIFVHTYMI